MFHPERIFKSIVFIAFLILAYFLTGGADKLSSMGSEGYLIGKRIVITLLLIAFIAMMFGRPNYRGRK